MMSRFPRKGFTLIEVIIAITILGVAFLGLTHVVVSTTEYNIDVDVTTQAVLLSRDVMATTMAKDFDDISDVSTVSFGGGFNDYSYSVDVEYVDAANLNTPVAGPTDYKRIVVTVTANGWAGTISLYNLKANT